MLYKHWRDIPKQRWRWKNFSPREISCRHCGEIIVHEFSLDMLQSLRDFEGPMIINSAYRCPIHNAMVGGAPLSMHKFGRAFDWRISGEDKHKMINSARKFGFNGLGVNYRSFVHIDTGAKRSW